MGLACGADTDYAANSGAYGITVDNANPYTLCGWVKRSALSGANQICLNVHQPAIGTAAIGSMYAYHSAGADDLKGYVYGQAAFDSGYDIVTGDWVHVALGREIASAGSTVTNIRVATTAGGSYLKAGIPIISMTINYVVVGKNAGSGAGWRGSMRHVRLWQAYLTDEELQAEAVATLPVKSGCYLGWEFDPNDGGLTPADSGTTGTRVWTSYGSPTLDTSTIPGVGSSTSVAPLAMGAYSRMRNG